MKYLTLFGIAIFLYGCQPRHQQRELQSWIRELDSTIKIDKDEMLTSTPELHRRERFRDSLQSLDTLCNLDAAAVRGRQWFCSQPKRIQDSVCQELVTRDSLRKIMERAVLGNK